jgi:AcrR family transcriptional regulator
LAKRASRIETEQRFVDAVGEVLARDGFTGIGVNAVCAAAGANKALLYRYFGGLDGLLQAYAGHGDFWPSIDEVTGPAEAFAELSPAERIQHFVPAYVGALQARPNTLAILAWETVARNALTAHLEAVREDWSVALGQRMSAGQSDEPPVDLPAIGAIVAGTTHYLLLRRRHIRTFGGLDLQSDTDQQRWVQMLVQMMVAVAT